MREREKETETRKGNVSTTGERNVKERKAGEKNKNQGFTTRSYPRLPALHQATRSRRLHPPA